MKITVSQQNPPTSRQDKKLFITFSVRGGSASGGESGQVIDKYMINKADDFLLYVDNFLNKRNNSVSSIAKADLEFVNVGILTERIIRSIIAGLRF